jgi:hypothetical protein
MPVSFVHYSSNPFVFHIRQCRVAQCDPPGTMVATSFGTSGKCTVDCVRQSSSTFQRLVSCFWCGSESGVGVDGGANYSAAVEPSAAHGTVVAPVAAAEAA